MALRVLEVRYGTNNFQWQENDFVKFKTKGGGGGNEVG